MSRETPQIRDVAERLIAYEVNGNKASEANALSDCLFGENLRPHLATLMGTVGYAALLSRALTLAKPDYRWLQGVHVNADGSLHGLDALGGKVDPDEIVAGCVALLAQLLGLLAAFIGEDLTQRMVREVWPKLPRNDLNFGNGTIE